MVAVVTAIVAAFLAGGIALYRERRLELASLLVATRIIESRYTMIETSLGVLDAPDSGLEALEGEEMEFLTAVPSIADFAKAWDEYGPVLARHLHGIQWSCVQSAASGIELILSYPQIRQDGLMFEVAHELQDAIDVLGEYSRASGWLRNPGRKKSAETLQAELEGRFDYRAWLRSEREKGDPNDDETRAEELSTDRPDAAGSSGSGGLQP